MSIGMTYAEYWQGDNYAPKYYREAFKAKEESVNHEAWLQGLYFYDALVSVMSQLNSKKETHKSYTPKPYSFTPEDIKKDEEERRIEAEAQAEVWLKSWVSATQKQFKNEPEATVPEPT